MFAFITSPSRPILDGATLIVVPPRGTPSLAFKFEGRSRSDLGNMGGKRCAYTSLKVVAANRRRPPVGKSQDQGRPASGRRADTFRYLQFERAAAFAPWPCGRIRAAARAPGPDRPVRPDHGGSV